MKVCANKILSILIIISFAFAVFEVDLGSHYNTFHDEDDTYVVSNNQNVKLIPHFEKQKGITAEYCDFEKIIFNLFFSKSLGGSNSFPPTPFISRKIFVRNSVWRI
jgi:hypothetical protein